MVDKNKYVKKFQELHKSKTGNDLTDDEALQYFESLVSLVRAVYQPIPKDNGVEIENK